MKGLGRIFMREALNVARAGVDAAERTRGAAPADGKRKRRRVKRGGSDCTPCAAYDMVDRARENARDGKLL